MRRILVLIIVVFVMVPYAGAQTKDLKKEAKIKYKELKKNGYELFPDSADLDEALLFHYTRLNERDGMIELSGISSRTKSRNVGKRMALNNACDAYATQADKRLTALIAADVQVDSLGEDLEVARFHAAYIRYVSKQMKALVRESLVALRDYEDGTYEILIYFIVDEESAAKARQKALERAIKENKISKEHTGKLTGFVKEKVAAE